MADVVLGLDQSSSFGMAVSTMDGKIVESCTKKFKGERGTKLCGAYDWLMEIVPKLRPVAIAYEEPHLRGGPSSFLCVSFCGVITMVAHRFNIPLMSVHTQTLKKFATGSGSVKVKKPEMTAAASAIIGRELSVKENNDEADAIHIARWGASQLQNKE